MVSNGCTHNTTGQAARHGSEAHEQHNTSLPGDTIASVREVVGRETALVNAVDDEHAHGAEDARDPVHKGHVNIAAVQRTFGKDGGIYEGEEGYGELGKSMSVSSFLSVRAQPGPVAR